MLRIKHHGAVQGITGSCHELFVDDEHSILVDCGLFQGAEVSGSGTESSHLEIEFDFASVQALFVTHVHIDHVGRLPYLLAAGFNGSIYCSKPSAGLLPLVIEDTLKVSVIRNTSIIEACLDRLAKQLHPIDYGHWVDIPIKNSTNTHVKLKIQKAGHILGSAYGVFRVQSAAIKAQGKGYHDTLFSGDLDAPHSPLLPSSKSPYRTDQLVTESTYGDRNHKDKAIRRYRLQKSLEHALSDFGSVLIPAFSINRTKEQL